MESQDYKSQNLKGIFIGSQDNFIKFLFMLKFCCTHSSLRALHCYISCWFLQC